VVLNMLNILLGSQKQMEIGVAAFSILKFNYLILFSHGHVIG
jgi:hypothetical protein